MQKRCEWNLRSYRWASFVIYRFGRANVARHVASVFFCAAGLWLYEKRPCCLRGKLPACMTLLYFWQGTHLKDDQVVRGTGHGQRKHPKGLVYISVMMVWFKRHSWARMKLGELGFTGTQFLLLFDSRAQRRFAFKPAS
jgi:hypothetical protein